MLTIKDGEGKLPQEIIRKLFEQMVLSTAVLKERTPLGKLEINGKFIYYSTPETDDMWIGFALGMRCAQRITHYAVNEAATLLDELAQSIADCEQIDGEWSFGTEEAKDHHDRARKASSDLRSLYEKGVTHAA